MVLLFVDDHHQNVDKQELCGQDFNEHKTGEDISSGGRKLFCSDIVRYVGICYK